jgi:hypothetical protein
VIVRIMVLMAVTGWYWFVALTIIGSMLWGDCLDAAACSRAYLQTIQRGMAVAIPAYGAIMAFLGWGLFRRRA